MSQNRSMPSLFDMCCIAVFAAIIAVLAQISVPMAGGVPVTLQTMAVALAGIVLGGKRGALACVIYLLLGAVGLPVFAGARAGLSSIVGVTGGFLISFPLLSFFAGLGIEKAQGSEGVLRLGGIALGLISGAALNYAVGTVWYAAVSGNSMAAGFAACVAPFIINDVIKLVIAAWVGLVLRRALKRAGMLTECAENL